jgi:hypothetical protein
MLDKEFLQFKQENPSVTTCPCLCTTNQCKDCNRLQLAFASGCIVGHRQSLDLFSKDNGASNELQRN